MDFEQLFRLIGVMVTAIGSISGAIWAFRKCWVRDEHFPRVAFDLKVGLVDQINDQQIVEVVAVLENKGVVPLRICQFTCEIRGILDGDILEIGGKDTRKQLNFRHLLRDGWFIPVDWDYSFVYPEIKRMNPRQNESKTGTSEEERLIR